MDLLSLGTFDIIAISEPFISDDGIPCVPSPYIQIVSPSFYGVALLVKHTLSVSEIAVSSDYIRAINVKLENSHEITVVSFYMQTSRESIAMNDFKNFLSLHNQNVLICGDFNAHSAQTGYATSDSLAKKFEELFEETGLCILNTPGSVSYTHLTLPTTPYV